MEPYRRRRLAPLVLVAALALVPACGEMTGETGKGGATTPRLQAARATIARFRQVPPFTPPGPAFEAAKLRGKTIFEIPITSEVPFIQAVEAGMRQAADAVGVELVVYPNQGTPTQWAQGIDAAIARQADAITLLAQDPGLLGPQIDRAEKAGIPVVVVRTSGDGERCPRDAGGQPYGTACVPGPFAQAGRLEADWVIADTDGTANVLVLTSRDAPSTSALLRGLEGEFETRCPSCRLRFVDVPIPEWARRIRGEVESALVRDPDLDYVVATYDSMSQFVVPAIRARGAGGRVKIAGFNGTPFVLQMLQDGDIVRMDAGEPLAWVGWATVDQALRVMAGMKPVSSEHTPLRVFDDENVDQAGRPPRFDTGYGKAYISGYRRLWRLTP